MLICAILTRLQNSTEIIERRCSIEIDRLDSKRFAVYSRDGSPTPLLLSSPPLSPPPPPPSPSLFLPLMVLECSVPISGDLLNSNSVLVRKPRTYEVYATTSAKASQKALYRLAEYANLSKEYGSYMSLKSYLTQILENCKLEIDGLPMLF
ncbi:hypothetical protein V1478_006916 [Vespula squamosa]|uniref:Uncharacterized protein n=1 Tax=Vespula squamosa TaxID=30214 RepID=A0ABD2B1Q1_VESSQ